MTLPDPTQVTLTAQAWRWNVTLSWDAVAGVESYEIERDGEPYLTVFTTSLTEIISGQRPHTYGVTAVAGTDRSNTIVLDLPTEVDTIT